MDKFLVLENGSRYHLCPMNKEEFDIWVGNSPFKTFNKNWNKFKELHNYYELSDFGDFLLKNSKIEIRDSGSGTKFILKNYYYELENCGCDSSKKEACSDCPKDDDLRELQTQQR